MSKCKKVFNRAAMVALLCTAALATAQKPQEKTEKPPIRPRESHKEVSPAVIARGPKAAGSRKFALDVVRSAVALPQSDQQDRLRVLSAAAEVLGPISPKLTAGYVKEGVGIESELIGIGEKPAVSFLALGLADCKTATDFAQAIHASEVAAAEQSLIGAFSRCPKQTGELIKTRTEAAMQQRVLAPRLLMALIQGEPIHSGWSEREFAQLFSSLPSDPEAAKAEAPNFASMFATTKGKVDKDTARDSGLSLLRWLGKMEESGDRNLAINITVSGLKELLGAEGYQKALERDVIARQTANLEGSPGEASREEEESVSVNEAMSNSGTDQTEDLKNMPPSLRARQAAAFGFAKGTSNDRPAADRYFDIAFSAADEAWSERGDRNLAPLIQEVSEAAAQVDATAALRRAQGLQDPSAKAIGMIAVARVVMSRNLQQ